MARNTYMKHGKNMSNGGDMADNNTFNLEDEKGCFKEFFNYSFIDNDYKYQDYLSEVDYSDIYCNSKEDYKLNKITEEEIFQADDFLSSNFIVLYSFLLI